MTRYYGVDLGTRRIALACPEVGLVWHAHTTSAADMRRYPSEAEAGRELGRRTLETLAEWNFWHGLADDRLFICERPFAGHRVMNIRTAIGQGVSAGAAVGQLPGRLLMLDSPGSWKKALCGNGSADKDEIRAWIEQHHPALAAACNGVEDCYDAVGIALAGPELAPDGDL